MKPNIIVFVGFRYAQLNLRQMHPIKIGVPLHVLLCSIETTRCYAQGSY
ncbi:MAG: hypothetical protein AB1589_07955 [Cyanobacteriota bacterium]